MTGEPATAGDGVELVDAAATEAAGAALAATLVSRQGAVVFLDGDLGAGKTTLARGLLRALGVTGPVRSPTYTLIEPYAIQGRSVVHMDLYRLADPGEWWALGLDSYPPEQNLWLVEWPLRAQGLLPAPTLILRLAVHGHGRRLQISGEPEMAAALQSRLKSQH